MGLDSTHVHVVEQAPPNGCCQYPLPIRSPEGFPRSAAGSDPDFFQIASALSPGLCEILCVSFKTESLFPKALWLF